MNYTDETINDILDEMDLRRKLREVRESGLEDCLKIEYKQYLNDNR